MRVEQAVFGELDRGHGLRASTGDWRLAAELAPRLDLPDTAPPGVAWSPFLSGFAHHDRYVVARTFHDSSASRSGMVLAHALVAPLDEVAHCDDLRPLLAALVDAPRLPRNLSSLDLDMTRAPVADAAELVGLAEALMASGNDPVVRLGVEGFDDLIVALWRHLWPAIRRNLSFRLSFGPDDVREAPRPTLVCTPQALATRWRGARLVDPTPREAGSAAVASLSGRPHARSLLSFAGSIGAGLSTFPELRLAEQALMLDEDAARSFDEAAATVRFVQRLSPDPDRGTEAKARMLERLSAHVAAADGRATLALRNLDLDGFRGSADVWADVGRVVASSSHHPATDASSLAIVGAALYQSGAVAPWRDAVLAGLRVAARRPDGGFAAAFWRWAAAEPGLAERLAVAIDLDSQTERPLVDAAPRTVGEAAARAIASIARARGLRELHGIAASTMRPPLDAARAQLALEGDRPGGLGLALALRDATADDLLSCALALDDLRLVDLAGRALVGRAGHLAVADTASIRGQAIWTAALSIDAGAWAVPVDPEAAVRTVISNLLDGRPADGGLVAALGGTPLADLHHFERRSEAWDKLRRTAGAAYLDATAAGWIRRSTDGVPTPAPDPTLEDAILRHSPFQSGGGRSATVDLAGGLAMASALPRLGEQDVWPWLERTIAETRDITRADGEALGLLILERGWRRVLELTKRSVSAGRADLRPVLVIAASMMNWFDIWFYAVSTPSQDEKWEMLARLAAELYPSGPSHEDLWERVGGSDADLPTTGTGRELWRGTLARMRRGGGRVRVDRLLRGMTNEYGGNEQLRLIASDPEFGGGRWI